MIVSPSAFFCTFPAFNACIPLHCGALVWLAGISWPANKNLGESVWGIRSLAFTCLGYLSSLFVFQYDIIQYRKILHMILQCKLWNAHNVEKKQLCVQSVHSKLSTWLYSQLALKVTHFLASLQNWNFLFYCPAENNKPKKYIMTWPLTSAKGGNWSYNLCSEEWMNKKAEKIK